MTIVLVDHAFYRLGLRLMLETCPGFGVVGEAGTAGDALRVISAVAPDLAVVDLRLPALRGMSAIRKIRRCVPGVRVLVLTEHGRTDDVVAAFKAGASGYALKGDSNDEILQAFHALRSGRRYLAPSLHLRGPLNVRFGHAMTQASAPE